MKISWGVKIAATYIIFVTGVIIMVMIFMNQDVHLVTENYYAKDLEYQEQIDKIDRTARLKEQLEIVNLQSAIKFVFPTEFSSEVISGHIHFYRPSDQSQDFGVEITTDSAHVQTISTVNMMKGVWKVKVDWAANGNTYYNEKILMVN